MKLVNLNFADIHRDGGSYGASFQTDNGLTYNLWLQRSKMPDDEGPHHRWLYEYFGPDRPRDCLPIITGGEEQKTILGRLKEFLALPRDPTSPLDRANFDRLSELVHYIKRREPCLPSDLSSWRPEAE